MYKLGNRSHLLHHWFPFCLLCGDFLVRGFVLNPLINNITRINCYAFKLVRASSYFFILI